MTPNHKLLLLPPNKKPKTIFKGSIFLRSCGVLACCCCCCNSAEKKEQVNEGYTRHNARPRVTKCVEGGQVQRREEWWVGGGLADGEGKDLDQGHAWFHAYVYFSSFPIYIERRLMCVGVCV